MSTLKVDTIQAKSATTVSVPSGQTLSIAGTLDASSGSVKIPAAGVGPTGYGSSASPITYTVKVITKTAAHPYYGTGSSSGYTINDIEGGTLQLTGADTSATYYHKFDQADSSNSGHPLLFYLDAAKTTAYTTNVTATGTPGSAGAYTTIQVDEYTPNILYYQCSNHAHMGNYVTVVSNKFNTNGVALKLPTADGTSGQAVVTDGSGSLSFAVVSGLTTASLWRLTATFTGSADPIALNLAAATDVGQGVLGSAMTESSGVFTFPSTGYWHVTATFTFNRASSTDPAMGAIKYTSNNGGAWSNAAQIYDYLHSAAQMYGTVSGNCLFDITDTANQKVSFKVSQDGGSNTTSGSSTVNYTCFTFIKLGDT